MAFRTPVTIELYPEGVYPLCFGTMESHDKGNPWQSNSLRQLRIVRQEGGGEKEGGAKERTGGGKERKKGRKEGKGRKDKRGGERREDGTRRGRVGMSINRGRERRRRKEEKAQEGERRKMSNPNTSLKGNASDDSLIPPSH